MIKKINYFSEFFELTFLDCLEHLRGTKYIELLKDMGTMKDFLGKYDKEVHSTLIEGIYNYENFIKNRKSRRPRDKDKKGNKKNEKKAKKK